MKRLVVVAALLLGGCGESQSGDNVAAGYSRLHLASSAFADGGTLAAKYSCDGPGDEPAVRVTAVPAGAKELVLTVTDPDAPGGTFTHLVRFGLPAGGGEVSRGSQTLTNSGGSPGWTPPCPPSGTHRYVWTVYALGRASGLKTGGRPETLDGALDSVLAKGTLTARYSR